MALKQDEARKQSVTREGCRDHKQLGKAVAASRCKEGSQARQQWKNFRYNLDNTITLAGRNSLWPDEHYLIYQRVLSDAGTP